MAAGQEEVAICNLNGARKVPVQQVQDAKITSNDGPDQPLSETVPAYWTSFLSQEPNVREAHQYYANLSLEEKRKLYSCGDNFVTLDQIPTWDEEPKKSIIIGGLESKYKPSSVLNKKVSLWHGDITRLEIDAIVSSASIGQLRIILPPPGSVRAALHEAAGPMLDRECQSLPHCRSGTAVVTCGYSLPAKLVIHASAIASSIDDDDDDEEEGEVITKCYQHCLELTLTHNIESIAFCCIGTGGLGFSKASAAHIALKTTREWLEVNAEKVERIIFCTHEQRDRDIYSNFLHGYFPIQDNEDLEPSVDSSSKELETEKEKKKQIVKRLKEETARAEREKGRAMDAEQRLEHQIEFTHQLQRQVEDQKQEIHQLCEIIHQQENRIQQLTQSVAEMQEHEIHMEEQMHQKERQLANSDRIFQDIFQRLLGQVPQSQPHWVVRRDEIQVTEEELGTGGWAVVKVAVFRGQRVAAKCLHNQIISAHNVRLFTREMNMAAHARHPNLLQFIGATIDNNPIILTELMPTSLRRVLQQGIPLSHRQIVSIASDVARALNYLHLTSPDPIIHRDVSSANVLLKSTAGDSYEAKLSDYGSANFVRYATTVGPGNPLYSAPEVNDPKQHSPKMDVYSFGLLLVEMCSGELFDDFEELIHTRISADWPEMVAVIRPCICQDPRRRPSAADIITQLEQL